MKTVLAFTSVIPLDGFSSDRGKARIIKCAHGCEIGSARKFTCADSKLPLILLLFLLTRTAELGDTVSTTLVGAKINRQSAKIYLRRFRSASSIVVVYALLTYTAEQGDMHYIARSQNKSAERENLPAQIQSYLQCSSIVCFIYTDLGEGGCAVHCNINRQSAKIYLRRFKASSIVLVLYVLFTRTSEKGDVQYTVRGQYKSAERENLSAQIQSCLQYSNSVCFIYTDCREW